MATGGTIPNAAAASRLQLAATGAGLISEPFPFATTTANAAPTSQRVYGLLTGFRAGDIATGVLLRLATAASGTAPTTARSGLADSTGKMLAISGNVGAAASWPLGPAPLALAAPFTILTDGSYYLCFVVNGSWGTTQPSLAGTSFAANGSAGPFGTAAAPFFTWDGQTDLPAVGASLTMTASAAVRYMAAY